MRSTPIIILAGLLLVACSDPAPEKPKEQKSHVWQGQTEMLKEAKKVGEDVNAQLRQQEERLKAARSE